MVVNPVEKNITEHKRMILTVIWSLKYLIVILLNDSMYHFVPTYTNHTMILMHKIMDIISQAKTGGSCAMQVEEVTKQKVKQALAFPN